MDRYNDFIFTIILAEMSSKFISRELRYRKNSHIKNTEKTVKSSKVKRLKRDVGYTR